MIPLLCALALAQESSTVTLNAETGEGITITVSAPATPPAPPVPPVAPEAPLAPEPPASPLGPGPDLEDRLAALEERVAELEAQNGELEARLAEGGGLQMPGSGPLGVRGGPVVVAAGEKVERAVSYGGPIEVYGTVRSDAVAMGGDLRVHPGGKVRGNALSIGGEVEVLEGGEVLGDQLRVAARSQLLPQIAVEDSIWERGWEAISGLARRLAVALSFAGMGVLVVAFWPDPVARVATRAVERPLWYGIGGAFLAGTLMVGALALAVTGIGLPFSLLLLALLAAAWLLGLVGLCQAVGGRLVKSRERSWVVFLAGAALIGALTTIPYLGPALFVLLGFPAIGAAFTAQFNRLFDPEDL